MDFLPLNCAPAALAFEASGVDMIATGSKETDCSRSYDNSIYEQSERFEQEP